MVGQALSHVRALQSGAWISKKKELREPHYDAEAIHRAVRQAIEHDQGWESFFRQNDIEPYRIGYESLCADFEGELSRLLPFLGVDPRDVDSGRIVEGALGYFKKQRDGLTESWRARYTDWLRQRTEPGRAGTGASSERAGQDRAIGA